MAEQSALLCFAGACVGIVAAGFAILFMQIHKVVQKAVSLLGLHVSIRPCCSQHAAS